MDTQKMSGDLGDDYPFWKLFIVIFLQALDILGIEYCSQNRLSFTE